MRLIRIVIAVVFVTMPLGRLYGEQVDPNGEPNDLSAYYGFGEIEIVKLDRAIKNLRIVDLNGDGRLDIAIANNRKAKIELLIQKEAVGPGEAAVVVDADDVDINLISGPTRFDKQPVVVSQKINSLVCGDLNADGMVDLAFYGEPKGLYVILQKAGETETDKAKLSWRTRKKIKIDDGLVTSGALVCSDLNNDGRDDLVLAGRDSVYVIAQKDDGSLAEAVKYPTTVRTLAVRVSDLNGDGVNDLVLITGDAEKPVHVRFGLKSGQLGPQEQFFIEKPLTCRFYDVDGSGGDEIISVEGRTGRLICYEFSTGKEQQIDADWPTLFYPLTSGEANTKRDLVTGDFNGDDLIDVIISEPDAAELILYKQNAEVGLAEPVRFPAFSDITALSVADIDRDGKDELAVLSVKEKVIGISEFEDDRLSFPKPLDLVGEPVAMGLADVDGNKKIDCLYISRDANDVRSMAVIYNLGAKKVKTGAKLELKKLASNPDGLKILDVDQDGLQDVLIFVKYEQPILVRQTGKGEFEVVDSPKAQASLIKEAGLSSIAVADVDGKAGKELLVAQKNFARSLVFANGKSWTIEDQYNAKDPENNISVVAVFDIDQKEKVAQPAILLLDSQKGQLQILKTGDDKTYRVEKQLSIGRWNAATHLKMLYAPLTGGAVKSILLFDSEKFALLTPPAADNVPHYLEQLFSYETKIKDGSYGSFVAGDINSDERTDLVMVEYKRNHIEILALDAQLKPAPAMRFKVFEQKSFRGKEAAGKFRVEPRELRIADVTGDGKDDLVTVIHDRIIIYPQD